jgi:inactivated superfamily I helicase
MAAAVVLKSHLAGYSTIRPQPRGIGGSTGPMNGLSLRDLAADAMAAADDGPIIVIGHDYWSARRPHDLSGSCAQRCRSDQPGRP